MIPNQGMLVCVPEEEHSDERESILDTLKVMRIQEEKSYRVDDYLHLFPIGRPEPFGIIPRSRNNIAECRYKMVEWCYQVAEYGQFHRETVAVAMSYLDRFLCCSKQQQQVLSNVTIFQMAAMTSLYMAVKIHELEAIAPSAMASLSQGMFTVDHLEAMEATILNAIDWRVNPPTAGSFLRYFVALVPDLKHRRSVYELATYQTEVAVGEYHFVTTNKSSIAAAALSNAVECLDSFEAQTWVRQHILAWTLMKSHEELQFLKDRLFEAVSNQSSSSIMGGMYSDMSQSKLQERRSSFDVSPCPVSVVR